jgi:tRNA 2-selenouridine synthase
MSANATPRNAAVFAAHSLDDLRQFDAVIDVRSPGEYLLDHVPGAVNFPVLDDDERAAIGTLHKQTSPFEAKRKGAAIVARRIGQMLEQPSFAQTREWRPLVMCWRGGKRSGSLAHVLRQIGWPALQLDGGYRAYRALVNDALTTLPAMHRFIVVAGRTGSGKSRLLTHLNALGAQVLDLEQIANHRGSVLGGVPDLPQPSQKWFESQLLATLSAFSKDMPVFVESESKKIGDLRVPEALMMSMRASRCVVIEASESARVDLLLAEYAHFLQDSHSLSRQLACLTALHGREKIDRWNAFSAQSAWRELVQELLRDHYDPAYDRSMLRNFAHLTDASRFSLQNASDAAFEELARQLIAAHGAAPAELLEATHAQPITP